MIKSLLTATALTFTALGLSQNASAHCQIPCGIYDDANVLSDLHLHYVTIEKSAAKIKEIGAGDATAAHDLARWTLNKENHCDLIIDTVGNYFLAQRLKVSDMENDKEGYMKKLTLCHQVIVAAMKCKQKPDSANLKSLHDLLHDFDAAFSPKKAAE